MNEKEIAECLLGRKIVGEVGKVTEEKRSLLHRVFFEDRGSYHKIRYVFRESTMKFICFMLFLVSFISFMTFLVVTGKNERIGNGVANTIGKVYDTSIEAAAKVKKDIETAKEKK